MDFINAIILGVIEGVTEFLPISSTGHLILASDFLGIEQTEFVKTFQIVIQSGAVLSVIFLYRQTLLKDTELIKRIFVAFIPTAVLGFMLYGFIKQYLLGNPAVVLWSLFLGGVVLIVVELIFQRGVTRLGDPRRAPAANARMSGGGEERQDPKQSKLSYKQAFAIGLFQSISMIPGVSRAAATIIGGMIAGLSRKQAVEFSFLLAIPTIIGASALDATETNILSFTSYELIILSVGFIVSFIVALAAIKWLLKYIENHTFIPFGIYRIALSILYFLFIFS